MIFTALGRVTQYFSVNSLFARSIRHHSKHLGWIEIANRIIVHIAGVFVASSSLKSGCSGS